MVKESYPASNRQWLDVDSGFGRLMVRFAYSQINWGQLYASGSLKRYANFSLTKLYLQYMPRAYSVLLMFMADDGRP